MAGRSATKSYEYNSDGRDPDSACGHLAQRIGEVCLDAVASLPPAKIQETALQWLAKALFDPSDPSNALPVMEAFALAG